jgi:hypothetical protein
VKAEAPPISRSYRPLRFWLILALVGAASAALAGLLGGVVMGLIGFLTVPVSAPTPSLLELVKRSLAFLVVGLMLALPLIPITLVALPASYRWAISDSQPRPARHRFFQGALAGAIAGPVAFEALMHLSRLLGTGGSPSFSGLSLFYIMIGLLVAPIMAFLLWPLVKRLDGKFGAGALESGS